MWHFEIDFFFFTLQIVLKPIQVVGFISSYLNIFLSSLWFIFSVSRVFLCSSFVVVILGIMLTYNLSYVTDVDILPEWNIENLFPFKVFFHHPFIIWILKYFLYLESTSEKCSISFIIKHNSENSRDNSPLCLPIFLLSLLVCLHC